MIRHMNSLVVSLLLHTLLLAGLYITIDSIVLTSSPKEEKRVCLNLSCCVENAEVPKKQEPISQVKPIEKKVVKTKKEKPKTTKVKKKVFVKEVKKREIKKEVVQNEPLLQEPEVQSQTLKATHEKSKVVVTPKKSEIVMKESSAITAQREYVNTNLVKISQLLQENLYYPRRARKRGTQGEVLVKFTLSKNAEVSAVEVLSSTSDILSRGAIRTIENLSFKFPKPKEDLTLKVPILYKLN